MSVTLPTGGSKMRLFFWRPRFGRNFGDELSLWLLQRLVGHDIEVTHDRDTSPKLLAIGSILHCANDGDSVWGTGLKTAAPRDGALLDVRAVRGPLTRARLLSAGICCPNVLGDPALLLPRVWIDPRPPAQHAFGILPHFNDTADLARAYVISPLAPPQKVIRRILSCKFLLSSSLHGIIVADAFGIPARLIAGNEVAASPTKYEDYFASTGRSMPGPVGAKEALALGPQPPPQMPDLDALLGALPRELLKLPGDDGAHSASTSGL